MGGVGDSWLGLVFGPLVVLLFGVGGLSGVFLLLFLAPKFLLFCSSCRL